jgi:hypothetical protein
MSEPKTASSIRLAGIGVEQAVQAMRAFSDAMKNCCDDIARRMLDRHMEVLIEHNALSPEDALRWRLDRATEQERGDAV